MTVICEPLGVPEPDRDAFHGWTSTVMAGRFAGIEALVEAYVAMDHYVRQLLDDKCTAPADDLPSGLVGVRDGGDQLSETELVGMVMGLVVAGHETTVNLIGNGVHALLTHPDQLDLLRAEPDRLPAAVEELLRHASPVQVSLPCVTTAPVPVGDVTIPAGEVVLAGLPAANRDPSWVEDPARLDITRGEQHHVAFGHGIHHCLGAAPARVEGQVAIGTLLTRYPDPAPRGAGRGTGLEARAADARPGRAARRAAVTGGRGPRPRGSCGGPVLRVVSAAGLPVTASRPERSYRSRHMWIM